MPGVPDRYVLEHTTLCAQYVVGMGVHLPDFPLHGPCADVLQPRLVPWEEVASHILHLLLCHSRCNTLVPLLALWYNQVGVEIAGHQQHAPPGPLADGRDDFLYC